MLVARSLLCGALLADVTSAAVTTVSSRFRQVLLRAVFELQREEDEESGGHSAAGSAAAAADLMDPLTLTEVLRRHLTARGAADEQSKYVDFGVRRRGDGGGGRTCFVMRERIELWCLLTGD